MKKTYITPLTEVLDMETTGPLAESQPSADIPYPGIGDSRLMSDTDWDEDL